MGILPLGHRKLLILVGKLNSREVIWSHQVTYVEVLLQIVLCGLDLYIITLNHKKAIHIEGKNENDTLSLLCENCGIHDIVKCDKFLDMRLNMLSKIFDQDI